MNSKFEDIQKALKYFVDKLLKQDILKSKNIKNLKTYKKGIIELSHQFFEIKNPKKVLFKIDCYKCYGWWVVGEILSEMLNINPPIMINYNRKIISWAYDLQTDGTVEYMYGGRWNEYNLLSQTYDLLKKNITSKRAVIPIFTPYDVSKSRNDVPCNTQYQFLCRNNKLNMTIIVRSWDITKGYKYDFTLYSFILQVLASWLNVEIGSLFIYVNSLHCYLNNIEELKNIQKDLNNNPKKIKELDIDENLEIKKTYNDLRKIRELEILIRNKVQIDMDKELKKLNYKFARDFVRIFWLKNNGKNNKILNSMETKCKQWCLE